MMRRTTTDSAAAALAAILLLPVLGCAGIQSNPDAVALYEGTYTFSGQVSQHVIDGYIAFDEGTYHMSSPAGSCTGLLDRTLERQPRPRMNFRCGTLTVQLFVDGTEFGSHARASLSVPDGTDSRTVCESWGTDSQTRQRVCRQYVTSLHTKYATRHGTLTVAKVEADGN
jgi:hypothetical protein